MKNKNLFSKKVIKNITSYNLPFVVDENKIIAIIKNFLNREQSENISFEFFLPNKFSNLKPGDVLEISHLPETKNLDTKKNQFIIYEIIFFENFIKIHAYKYFLEIYNLNSFSILFKDFEGALNTNFLNQIEKNSKTFLKITQIPNLNKKNYHPNGFIGFFVAALDKNLNWKGSSIFSFQKNLENSEIFLDQIQKTNIFGKIIDLKKTSSKKISPLLIDYDSEIFISFSFPDSQKIFSVSQEEFFSFQNLAKIGDEIIAFKETEYVQNGIYKIKILLRGLFGTESFVESNKINQDFFLIDKNFLNEKIENQMIGYDANFKAVTFGETLVNFFESKIFLKNFYSLQHTICNIEIEKNNLNEFRFNFQKRLRIHDSQFVVDENFELFKSVVFEEFNNPKIIQKIELKDSNGFLIRIFENKKKEKLIFENVTSNLFFEFAPKENFEKIYIEIASLNSIYLAYYYLGFFADLKNCKIFEIEYLKNF